MASIAQTELNPDCECGEFFKNTEFKNLCSKCFLNKYCGNDDNFDIILKLLGNKRKYSKNYLDELTKNRSLPDDHFLWAALKQMFEIGSVIEENNFLDWVSYLESKTIYRGITTKQGVELKALADNSKNQYVKQILKDEHWKLGHNICCLIVDWWNLPDVKIGVAQCYYYKTGKGDTPIMTEGKIAPAAIFSRVSNNDSDQNTLFEFALKNTAKGY
jgi:hypothetical protein